MQQEKIAVALYGLPGSGKGTQANLIANKYGLVNFDTGRYLETLWYDPKRQKDPVVKRERKLFEEGKLNTPSFVLNEVSKAVTKLAKKGHGVCFSGSPRTMPEATTLIPLLEKLYSKKGVSFFLLDIDPKDTLERNGKRMLCKVCRTPLLVKYYPRVTAKYCPECGGALYRRTLDNATIIPKRIEEYQNRTAPILKFLKDSGHKVKKVNGRSAPYIVFEYIDREIRKNLQ